jgi:heat shock protein HslJ
MIPRMRIVRAAPAALLLLAACPGPRQQRQEQSSSPAQTPITDREWVLVTLGNQASPTGRGNQPATLRFDATASHAAGFAGCNHFRASYTLSGDSLRFGPILATKMACADGDDLERSFLAALPLAARYESTDSTLILKGASAPLARFRAR